MARSTVSSLDLERGASPTYGHRNLRQSPSPTSLRPISRSTHYSRPLTTSVSPVPSDESSVNAFYRDTSLYSCRENGEVARLGTAVSQPNIVSIANSQRNVGYVAPIFPPPVLSTLSPRPSPVFSTPCPQPPPARSHGRTLSSPRSLTETIAPYAPTTPKLSKQIKTYDSSQSTFTSDVPEKPKISDSESFSRRVFEAGSADLLYDITDRKGLSKQTHGVLDLTTLERMSIHVLQAKLTEKVKDLGDRRAWMDAGIEKTLHEYCNAVRDLDFMEQCAHRGVHNDPFLIKTSQGLESKLLEDADMVFARHTRIGAGPSVGPKLSGGRRDSWIRQRLIALVTALVGGIALIGPFLIVTLCGGQLARIVTTSGFMVLVAVAISVGSELSPAKVGLLTAAYSAALVIYAGNASRPFSH